MASAVYESRELLDQYLLFHYGTAEQILPHPVGPREALDFPQRCVRELPCWELLPQRSKALDLGCAVGRSSFELTRYFSEVLAVDLSASFIEAAQTMQQSGCLQIHPRREGRQPESFVVGLPEGLPRERVRFVVGDALAPLAAWRECDLLLAANLLDRLPEPAQFLRNCGTLVRPGGQLVLTSPYTWLEEFTPREKWPEGDSLNFLDRHLQPTFRRLRTVEMPFLIREHARKYQWSVAQASVWQRLA